MCGGQRSTLGAFLNHSLLHLFQLLRGVATAPMWLSEDNVISTSLLLLPGSWRWNPLLGLHSQAPLATSPAPPCFFKSGSLTELVTSARPSGYRGFGICLSPPHSSPSTGVSNAQSHAQLLRGCWGPELGSPCLCSKCFTYQAHVLGLFHRLPVTSGCLGDMTQC